MSDLPDNIKDQLNGDTPYAEEPMDVEGPRRLASAQFVVESGVGSEAMLRDAMDPANQSLGEALRLSFRVLQVVIVVLVVLFVVSGAKTIAPGQSGVATVWGRIVERDGLTSLEPGLAFNWPYPAGDFVLFQAENRRVDVNNVFWPRIGRGQDRSEAIQQALIRSGLNPANDGYLLTAGNEVAHIQFNATYIIEDVRDFVTTVRVDESNREVLAIAEDTIDSEFVTGDALMQLALQRAAIHTAATSSLDELIRQKETQALGPRIRELAQAMLDDIGGGMQVTAVNTPDVLPPFAIEKLASENELEIENARSRIERARKRAEDNRLAAAGEGWREAIRRIESYERLVDDGASDEEAQPALDAVYAHFESDAVGGEVASIIGTAESYQSLVDTSLGADAERFASLLPAYRDHPNLVIRQRLMDSLQRVMAVRDTEVIRVPDVLSALRLQIRASQDIAELRRQQRLDEEQLRAAQEGMSQVRGVDRIPWGSQRSSDFRRRRLGRDAQAHDRPDEP